MRKRKKFRMKLVKLDKAFGEMVWYIPGNKSDRGAELTSQQKQEKKEMRNVKNEDEE